MKLHDSFSLASGRVINIEKTKVITIGAWRDSRIILRPELKLDWTPKSDSLGITFDVPDMANIYELYLKSRINEIKKVINIWTPICLTLLGSQNVIKSLLISKFTHILLSLTTPNKSCLDEIDGLLNNFLWGNTPGRYRANILESKQIEGGLGFLPLRGVFYS